MKHGRTVRVLLFAAYTLGWARVRTNISADIAGHQEGTLVGVDFLARYRPTEPMPLSAGPGATWASGAYMRTFLGISATQSAAAGLPQ